MVLEGPRARRNRRARGPFPVILLVDLFRRARVPPPGFEAGAAAVGVPLDKGLWTRGSYPENRCFRSVNNTADSGRFDAPLRQNGREAGPIRRHLTISEFRPR